MKLTPIEKRKIERTIEALCKHVMPTIASVEMKNRELKERPKVWRK